MKLFEIKDKIFNNKNSDWFKDSVLNIDFQFNLLSQFYTIYR